MKEQDIRPRDLFQELLAASRQDILDFFPDRTLDLAVTCPACGSSDDSVAFVKLGFPYRSCAACGSLYVSPRPGPEAFSRYLRGSNMGRCFGERFYRRTADRRRELVYRPRAQLVAATAGELLPGGPLSVADIGSGFGVFLEELQATGAFARLVGVEPDPALAQLGRQKGFGVLETSIEEAEARHLPGGPVQLATCFEVIEHVREPLALLQGIQRLLTPGGLLYLTTLTITGFDLQVLGERSNSIYPPHHINLLSVEGFSALVERAGLELLRLTTPGKLDVSIVLNALEEHPDLELPGYVHELLRRGDAFQRFLQENRLSSHVHVVARNASARQE